MTCTLRKKKVVVMLGLGWEDVGGGGKQKEVPHQTFPLRHAVKQKRFEN